jgi:hypothetical protein
MRGYRLQKANLIARKALNEPMNWWIMDVDSPEYERSLGLLRKTKKRCSCWMCGHRRRYEGLTIQELRQIE